MRSVKLDVGSLLSRLEAEKRSAIQREGWSKRLARSAEGRARRKERTEELEGLRARLEELRQRREVAEERGHDGK